MPTRPQSSDAAQTAAFADFVRRVEPHLRHALVGTYGSDIGREATAEALAWAWEHWDRASQLDRPIAYLYRVGQSRTRRLRRPPVAFELPAPSELPTSETRLVPALRRLSEQQRACTVLVVAMQWSFGEVAELLGVTKSTVQQHVTRGLRKLRDELDIEDEPEAGDPEGLG